MSGNTDVMNVALRYNLHPPKSGQGTGIDQLRPEAPPVRLFILGARAESSLPRPAWVQLAHMFPESRLHLIFIGPESMANRDDEFPLPERTASNPFGAVVEDRVWHQMKISTIVDYYHSIHQTGHFAPYDPYFDCFVLFHPGLGHPASSHEWEETLPMLLETKVPIISTGYTQFDLERDVEWVNKKSKGEFDVLLQPGENVFRSLRWDLNDMDPQDVSCGNWGVWAFRGKRYDIFGALSCKDCANQFCIDMRQLQEMLREMDKISVDGKCCTYTVQKTLYYLHIGYRTDLKSILLSMKPIKTRQLSIEIYIERHCIARCFVDDL